MNSDCKSHTYIIYGAYNEVLEVLEEVNIFSHPEFYGQNMTSG